MHTCRTQHLTLPYSFHISNYAWLANYQDVKTLKIRKATSDLDTFPHCKPVWTNSCQLAAERVREKAQFLCCKRMSVKHVRRPGDQAWTSHSNNSKVESSKILSCSEKWLSVEKSKRNVWKSLHTDCKHQTHIQFDFLTRVMCLSWSFWCFGRSFVFDKNEQAISCQIKNQRNVSKRIDGNIHAQKQTCLPKCLSHKITVYLQH